MGSRPRKRERAVSAVDAFRHAIESKDFVALGEVLAADITFHSAASAEPIIGKGPVLAICELMLGRVYEGLHYVGQYSGAVDTDGGGFVESHVLPFRASFRGASLDGVDIVELGADGLVQKFTVIVRPLAVLQQLAEVARTLSAGAAEGEETALE